MSAVVGGVAVGFGLLCEGGTLLVALWFGVRGLTARHNDRRWAREWERVEPAWRRHLRWLDPVDAQFADIPARTRLALRPQPFTA